MLWCPDCAEEGRVIESQQDDNADANEIRIVLPSDDDLWVALCALTPVSTTNRPFLDQQKKHKGRWSKGQKYSMSISTLVFETDNMA